MIPPMLALIALCEERGISLHVSFDPDPGPFPRKRVAAAEAKVNAVRAILDRAIDGNEPDA